MKRSHLEALGLAVLVIAACIRASGQDPTTGFAAADVDRDIEQNVAEELRDSQGQVWQLESNGIRPNAMSYRVYESTQGVRKREMSLLLRYMRTPDDAVARLDFFKHSVSVGGHALTDVGEEALIWSAPGSAIITFRQGFVVGTVDFTDRAVADDLSADVTSFAQAVVDGIQRRRERASVGKRLREAAMQTAIGLDASCITGPGACGVGAFPFTQPRV